MKKSLRTKKTKTASARKGTPAKETAKAYSTRRHQISVSATNLKPWLAASKHYRKTGDSFSAYVTGLVAMDWATRVKADA